jgi:hypothetical protein
MEPYKKFMSENIDEFCFRADYSSEIYTFWFGCQAGVDLQHDARRTRHDPTSVMTQPVMTQPVMTRLGHDPKK